MVKITKKDRPPLRGLVKQWRGFHLGVGDGGRAPCLWSYSSPVLYFAGQGMDLKLLLLVTSPKVPELKAADVLLLPKPRKPPRAGSLAGSLARLCLYPWTITLPIRVSSK